MEAVTLAQALQELFAGDPAARVRLEKEIRPGSVVAFLEGSVLDKLLALNFAALLKEGIDPRPFTIVRVKRELWGDEDKLPDIVAHTELGDAVLRFAERLAKTCPRWQVAQYFGFTRWHAFSVACASGSIPSADTVKRFLGRLEAGDEGFRASPSDVPVAEVVTPPASVAPPVVEGNPWARLRDLAKTNKERYGSPVVAGRLGVNEFKVRRRWNGEYRPDDLLDQRLVKEYPELVSGTSPVSASTPVVAPPVPETRPEIEPTPTIVSAAHTSLRAAVNLMVRLQEAGAFTDGDRMEIVKNIVRLLEGAGLDAEMMGRLGKVNPATTAQLEALFGRLGKGR